MYCLKKRKTTLIAYLFLKFEEILIVFFLTETVELCTPGLLLRKTAQDYRKKSGGSQELTQRRLTYTEEKTNPQRRGKEQQEKITKNLTNL